VFNQLAERYPVADNDPSIIRGDDAGIDIFFESKETEEIYIVHRPGMKAYAKIMGRADYVCRDGKADEDGDVGPFRAAAAGCDIAFIACHFVVMGYGSTQPLPIASLARSWLLSRPPLSDGVAGVNALLGKKAALNITFPYLLECTPPFGLPCAQHFLEGRSVSVKLCPE
jgi:hypothetical protein